MRQLTPYRGGESLWDFMSDVERAFDDIWRSPRPGLATARMPESFLPSVDMQESKDMFLVSVDLPGVDQKDIRIDVQDGRLTVSGERTRQSETEEGLFRRFEKSYGKFERSFQLPQNVNEEKIQARHENGVLEILIPKAEVAKPKSIAIESGKASGLFSGLLKKKDEKAVTSEH